MCLSLRQELEVLITALTVVCNTCFGDPAVSSLNFREGTGAPKYESSEN